MYYEYGAGFAEKCLLLVQLVESHRQCITCRLRVETGPGDVRARVTRA